MGRKWPLIERDETTRRKFLTILKYFFPISHSVDVIEVENLAKYYGEFLAVDHISFRVKKDEIFGFLGPNGAGKTTTIRMLTGILEPSEGRIRIFGLDARKDILRIKENIGVVPEMANPYIDLTAMQNLSLVGRLYGMRKGEIKERSEELLHLFGIYERRDKKVRSFSKGLRQRLSLAMTLLPDPELLFLDELTSGLDVMSARLIKKIIREENRRGKTIFMSTHNMNDANELCNRIAIINHGKIVAIDTPERIKSMGKKQIIVEVSLEPLEPELLKKYMGDEKIEVSGDKIIVHTTSPDDTIKKIVHQAEQQNLKIVSLATRKPTLEDVFCILSRRWQ